MANGCGTLAGNTAAVEADMQELHDPDPRGKVRPSGSTGHFLFDVLNATMGGEDKTPPHETLVWIALANMASREGRAWPAVSTLSKGTRLAQSTVKACLVSLEANRRIAHVGWHGPRGRQTKVYEVRTTGGDWTDPRRDMAAARPRRDTATTQPQPGSHVAVSRLPHSRSPDVTQPCPGYNPPSDPPMDPPNETPNVMRPHARDEVQGDRPRPETAIPFGPSEGTAKASGEAQPVFQLTPPGEDKPGKTRKRPARELPDDWQPNADALVLGRTLGFDAARVATEGAKMRDWARGDGKIKVDWHATFANWLRTASEREIARGIARKPIVPEPIRKSPGQPPRMVYPPKPPPPPPPEPTDPLDIYAPKGPWTEEEIRDIAERNAARIARVAAERAREAQGLPVE